MVRPTLEVPKVEGSGTRIARVRTRDGHGLRRLGRRLGSLETRHSTCAEPAWRLAQVADHCSIARAAWGRRRVAPHLQQPEHRLERSYE